MSFVKDQTTALAMGIELFGNCVGFQIKYQIVKSAFLPEFKGSKTFFMACI